MRRILFKKTGDAVFISHLDLMRLFQRAFKRGGLNLKHTQGFSPRALVSIALPLSVGVESVCEILDYELVDQELPFEEIKERLNRTMPAGVRVLEAYDSPRKPKDLTHLDIDIRLEYDAGIPAGAMDAICGLFARESLTVMKRGKNGPVEQDIIPMISNLEITAISEQELELTARVCAQNPSLNPQQMVSAIETYLPEFAPDFTRVFRREAIAADGTIFR
ncbi:MAG: TIGR03936 family radical SAM-associated protein [Oscillospiraceae bacterium]|nr:TIGR03936 family radical SAM-associated protein [Oscillospiraceae bacterium]